MRFLEKDNTQVITIQDDEPPSKRARSDDSNKELDAERTLNDCMASDVLDIKDVDELEVYGNEKQTSIQITSYTFEVKTINIFEIFLLFCSYYFYLNMFFLEYI